MAKELTKHIMMVRPISFRYNDQTAVNNYYQKVKDGLSPEDANKLAQKEFDDFVALLRKHKVEVYVFQDDGFPDTPDSIFPNNWVSFHEDGRIALYPMYAENRRNERREEMFDILSDDFGFKIDELEDFTEFENDGLFLEGTGSMVLDRVNKLAYAALSERTDIEVLDTFCERFDYQAVSFHAFQKAPSGERLPIYHTNVMMCMGKGFAVICLNAIDDMNERNRVKDMLKETGKKIIEISEAQKEHFAGNMLNLVNTYGQELMVMSTAAFTALRQDQIEALQKHAEIVHGSLDTIEALGGGSARCMMAEIFLPKES